jgi:cell division protein FtsW
VTTLTTTTEGRTGKSSKRPLREPMRTPATKDRHAKSARTHRTHRTHRTDRMGITGDATSESFSRSEPRPVWNQEAVGLLATVGFLTTIGLVFVLSASSVYSLGTKASVWTVFLRQLGWEALGLVALVLCSWLGLRTLKRFWISLWVGTVALLLAVKFTPLGVSRNGSTRWIGPSSFEIQPSELAKLAIVVSFARLLSLKRDYSEWRVAAKYLGGFGVPLVALVGLQPDLGTTFVIVAAGFSVLFAARLNGRWLTSILFSGGLFVFVSLQMNSYQASRVTAFLHPQSEAAFHIRRSLAGIEAGGLLGVGVGASRSKWGFLPNAHTDFIFSVISEEVGLVGAVIVVGLFVVFGLLGTRIALRAPDTFSSLLAFGITGWIISQAFANIAAVTGMAPVTGVPLPFVSQGGTAFVSLMVALGLLLDIARRGVAVENG